MRFLGQRLRRQTSPVGQETHWTADQEVGATHLRMNSIEKSPLCIARTVEAIALRGCGRAFHINLPVCTGLFPFPVGVVGNLGSITGAQPGFPNPLIYTALF
jgi:hypothetical protein